LSTVYLLAQPSVGLQEAPFDADSNFTLLSHSGAHGIGGAVPTATEESNPGAARSPQLGFIPLALITAVAAGVVR
jgi:hypothetical protein